MTEQLEVTWQGHTIHALPHQVVHAGRDAAAELCVHNPDVSRNHVIFYYSEGWCLADSSSNGTYVNGKKIDRMRLGADPVALMLGSPQSGALVQARVITQAPAFDAFPADEAEGVTVMGPSKNPFYDPAQTPAPIPAVQGPAISFGRDPGSTFIINDVYASRQHARAVPRDGGFIVEDLNSINGTFVNGVPIKNAFVTEGDRVTIGNTDFLCLGGKFIRARAHNASAGGLEVTGLGYVHPGGKKALSDITLRAQRGTLTAVIGPSGAGKSTLARVLVGLNPSSEGTVLFDEFDLKEHYEAVKTRIGLVPQDDVVHPQLTLGNALRYAADIRLPDDVDKEGRQRQIADAVTQLGLEPYQAQRIDKISGGQRKRVSVAMELLTQPSLLVLDEPTSGLDPALDRQVMRMLRDLADADRTVVVITHSVACLSQCDQILLLAPGGLTAYLGPPDEITAFFGTAEWGDIFQQITDEPEAAHQRWLAKANAGAQRAEPRLLAAPHRAASRGAGWLRQFTTLVTRQVNLMLADRAYVIILAALPIVVGLLPYVVASDVGLREVPAGDASNSYEPQTVLALLILGSTFIGVAMSIRDLVGERSIYLREKAVGLRPSAYLVAKLTVYGAFSIVSTVLMTLVSTIVVKPPTTQVVGFGPPLLELMVPLVLTTWASAALGLLVSSFVKTSDQVMPLLIAVLLIELVFSGGIVPMGGKGALDVVSKVTPSRWGLAAAAAGIGLNELQAPSLPPGAAPFDDPLWRHTVGWWWLDLGMVVVIGAVCGAATWVRLRAQKR